MNYIYPPIYKYIAFILIFFLFLRYYKVITQQNYLIIALVATIIIILLDYFLIENHTNLIFGEKVIYNETEDALHKLIETESEAEEYMYHYNEEY